jgi:hypothetical protein
MPPTRSQIPCNPPCWIGKLHVDMVITIRTDVAHAEEDSDTILCRLVLFRESCSKFSLTLNAFESLSVFVHHNILELHLLISRALKSIARVQRPGELCSQHESAHLVLYLAKELDFSRCDLNIGTEPLRSKELQRRGRGIYEDQAYDSV